MWINPQVRWYLGQLTHPKTWNFDVKHSIAIRRQFRVEKIPSSRDSQGSHDLPALATAHPTHHVVVPVAERRVNVTSSGPGVCLGVQFQWTKWLCNHSRGPTTSGGQYHTVVIAVKNPWPAPPIVRLLVQMPGPRLFQPIFAPAIWGFRAAIVGPTIAPRFWLTLIPGSIPAISHSTVWFKHLIAMENEAYLKMIYPFQMIGIFHSQAASPPESTDASLPGASFTKRLRKTAKRPKSSSWRKPREDNWQKVNGGWYRNMCVDHPL